MFKMELPSDPSLLCVVRGAIEQLTEAFGFEAAERRSVTRAVDEAITNIMRHSYQNELGRPIEVEVHRVDKVAGAAGHGHEAGFEVLLIDRGPAVDPSKMQGRPLDEIKPGGLGLHFIRQSMDVVEFKRGRGTNLLRLVKYMRPGAVVEAGKRREDLADLGPAKR
jgi:anti-sigma regulatory factor (Ser/Thr protein kinase)